MNRFSTSRIFSLFILLLLCPIQSVFAQIPDTYWQKCFGGSGGDIRALVRGTSDGGSIIGGFGSSSNGDLPSNAGGQDIAILKLDACGNKQWTKIIGGAGLDLLYGLAEIPGNGYYFAGSTSGTSGFAGYHGGSMDGLVGRLDASGNVIWVKPYGGSAAEVLSSIVVLADTSCVISGWTNSTDGDGGVISSTVQNAWLIKLDKNGNLLWKKVFGGNFATAFFDVSTSNDGGFIMTGHLVVPPGISNTDFYLVKADANGNLIWQKQYGGSAGDNARTARACSGGGYIAAGNTFSSDGDVSGFHGTRDGWIIKVDENGNLAWQKCIGGSQSEEIWEMMALPNDRYWFAAGTLSTDGDIIQNKGAQDALVIEMDGAGTVHGLKTLGGSTHDVFFGISSASDGSLLLSGNSGSNDGDILGNHGASDFILFKLKNIIEDEKDTTSCQPFLLNNVWIEKDTSFTSIIKDQCGIDSALVAWNVTVLPVFVQSIPDAIINAGESIQLTTTASGPVVWTGTGLSCSNCLNPSVQPIVESMYIVSTGEGDCKVSDTIIIRINGADSLYIPTAFTPNGDGLNDDFKAIGTATEYSMKVFNRWGNLVFQTNSVTQGWNGNIGGKMQASGVFVYHVRYKKSSGVWMERKGTVLLVR